MNNEMFAVVMVHVTGDPFAVFVARINESNIAILDNGEQLSFSTNTDQYDNDGQLRFINRRDKRTHYRVCSTHPSRDQAVKAARNEAKDYCSGYKNHGGGFIKSFSEKTTPYC